MASKDEFASAGSTWLHFERLGDGFEHFHTNGEASNNLIRMEPVTYAHLRLIDPTELIRVQIRHAQVFCYATCSLVGGRRE